MSGTGVRGGRGRVLLLLGAALTLLLTSLAGADTLRVPGDFSSIQEAIDSALPGDEVLVAAGVYNEVIDLRGKDVLLRSEDGPSLTTIDGAGFFRATVTCDSGEGSGTVIRGFTVTGGESFFGGGLLVQGSSPTILGCVIAGNNADAGGGLYSFQGSPALVNCLIRDNVANAGGAMAADGGSLVVVNCTISGNPSLMSEQFGGALASFDGSHTLFNSICWDNGPTEITARNESIVTVQHSIVRGGWEGPGFAVSDADPAFVDADGGDFSLGPFSPAVDAGFNPAVPGAIVQDLDTAPRFVDDPGVDDTGVGDAPIIDLGAFERSEPSYHVPVLFGTVQAAVDDASDGDVLLIGPGIYVESIDYLGKSLTLQSAAGPDETVLDGAGGDGSVVRFAGGEGAGAVLAGFTITGGKGVLVEIEPGVFQRRGGGVFIQGSSPTITDCILEANGGATVLGGGVFVDSGSPKFTGCLFRENLAHRGGGMRVRNGSPHVVACRFEGNGAIGASGGGLSIELDAIPLVEECLFENNTAMLLGGGLHCEVAAAVLKSCRFVGNQAERGGALALQGGGSTAAIVTDCGFYGNDAQLEGGAVYVIQSEIDIVNGVLSGNSATDGGGLWSIESDTEAIHCTFSANEALGTGGAVAALGDVSLFGCILWGNVADDGPALVSLGGSPLVSYCDIQGSSGSGEGWVASLGVDGGGNIDADPMFRDADGADGVAGTLDDDLRPGPSAVIDAGDASGLPPTIVADFGGGTRVVDGDLDGEPIVDLGAWELDPGDGVVVVANQTQGTLFGLISEALVAAVNGDELLANPAAFEAEPEIDFAGRAVTLRSTADVDQPAGGLYILANGVLLGSAPAGIMHLEGSLRVPASVTSDLEASALTAGGASTVTVLPDGALYVQAGSTVLEGLTTAHPLATIELSADPVVNAGTMTLMDGSMLLVESLANQSELNADGTTVIGPLVNEAAGQFTGHGQLVGDVTNNGEFINAGATSIIGDYTNGGTTFIEEGTLSIIGNMYETGSTQAAVVGGGGTAASLGLAVVGDYFASSSSSLSLPDPIWALSVRGDCDIAIDGTDRFDMQQARLAISAAPAVAHLEVMSQDLGPTLSGFDRSLPGRFPIGTLRLGPGPVVLVDAHDNADGDGGGREAIYVEMLVIEPGTTLTTGAHRIYYRELIAGGQVDDPANLVTIPECVGDVDQNGFVDVDDLVAVILDWGDSGVELAADVTGDGTIDVDDLVAVILAWGICL